LPGALLIVLHVSSWSVIAVALIILSLVPLTAAWQVRNDAQKG